MSREDLHFRLRIPADLKEKVERSAQASNRSMTAEIIHRISLTFDEGYIAENNKQAVLHALLEELRSVDNAIANASTKSLELEIARRKSDPNHTALDADIEHAEMYERAIGNPDKDKPRK